MIKISYPGLDPYAEEARAKADAKLLWFEEQHRLALRRRFGASSEKTDPDQNMLFDEAEVLAEPSVAEPTLQEITYKCQR